MTSHESDQCSKCYAYICQCAKAAETQSNTNTSIDDLNAQFWRCLSKSGLLTDGDLHLIMNALGEMEELGVTFTFPEKSILRSSLYERPHPNPERR
jgi:hypothetical protein